MKPPIVAVTHSIYSGIRGGRYVEDLYLACGHVVSHTRTFGCKVSRTSMLCTACAREGKGIERVRDAAPALLAALKAYDHLSNDLPDGAAYRDVQAMGRRAIDQAEGKP